MEKSNELLTVQEVAKVIGDVSVNYVNARVNDGTLPPSVVLPSGTRRWKYCDVMEYVKSIEQEQE